ncbi:MAG: hydrolase [Gammaproteobacteria bacterium]
MKIAPLDNALLGIQRGLTGAGRAVAKIASAAQFNNDNPADLSKAMVELKQAKVQVQASARVMRTADEILGTLLDEKV